MIVDVNAFVGAYPFRRVPGTSMERLIEAMDRVGIDRAWVSHLPSVFWRDPMAGNGWLVSELAEQSRLHPIPAIHPGLPEWQTELARVVSLAVPAVRSDPTFYRLDPCGSAVSELVTACGEYGMPLVVAVRLEDVRQRHPHDGAPELPAAAIRSWLRVDQRLRLIVTHADRGWIEEVHFGSTPNEAQRVWWDISWIWGPPEDHLQTLLQTIGAERFVFGTGQSLRLPEASLAKLDLADLSHDQRDLIHAGNVEAGLTRG